MKVYGPFFGKMKKKREKNYETDFTDISFGARAFKKWERMIGSYVFCLENVSKTKRTKRNWIVVVVVVAPGGAERDAEEGNALVRRRRRPRRR